MNKKIDGIGLIICASPTAGKSTAAKLLKGSVPVTDSDDIRTLLLAARDCSWTDYHSLPSLRAKIHSECNSICDCLKGMGHLVFTSLVDSNYDLRIGLTSDQIVSRWEARSQQPAPSYVTSWGDKDADIMLADGEFILTNTQVVDFLDNAGYTMCAKLPCSGYNPKEPRVEANKQREGEQSRKKRLPFFTLGLSLVTAILCLASILSCSSRSPGNCALQFSPGDEALVYLESDKIGRARESYLWLLEQGKIDSCSQILFPFAVIMKNDSSFLQLGLWLLVQEDTPNWE